MRVPMMLPPKRTGIPGLTPVEFNPRSKARLAEVDPKLADLMFRVEAQHPDAFEISEGMRDAGRQAQMVAEGKSQTLNSKHLTGNAVDIAMIGPNGQPNWNFEDYRPIAATAKATAASLGIPDFVWGGDWKTLRDGVHFQVGGPQAGGPANNLTVSSKGGAPMGLLDMRAEQAPQTFGQRIKSGFQDGSLFDSMAMAFNGLRMNPDQGLADTIGRRQAGRDDAVKRNRTAEVLQQIAPAAADLVREGLMSPAEALNVYRDQRSMELAARASEALARGDYQTAYALSLEISPQAAGQAIAQQYGPRNSEVTGGGMYTVNYENGQPTISVNENVQQAELQRIQAEADARRTTVQPPTAVIKAEEEDMAAINTIDQMNMELGNTLDLFGYDPASGQFTGPLQIGVGGAITGALGYLGASQGAEETRRAREAFDRFTTRYVNDSLQLNNGVQTEGDAQRAVAELGDANTTEAAYAALVELVKINEFARSLKEGSVADRRARYQLDPIQVPAPPTASTLPTGAPSYRVITPPGGNAGAGQ